MNTTGKIQKLSSIPEEVIELDQKYFPRPWKKADWDSLDLTQHGVWIFIQENRVIGFALFGTPQDETAHLLKILVLPEQRSSSLAQEFWKELSKDLRHMGYSKVYLEVEESNGRAQAYYQKLGFQLLRRVKSYYSGGETGLMMQLTL
jgi:[ribosomal protein S18]-alanine N-acetyltransferase